MKVKEVMTPSELEGILSMNDVVLQAKSTDGPAEDLPGDL